VQLSVWHAVYAGRDGVGSYQPAEMTTYLVAGNLLAVLLANQIDDTLAADIYRGDYVVGMLRPISFLGAHAASAVPQVLIRLLLVTVPILVLAAIAVPLVAPTPEGLRGFLLSAGLAAVLGVLLNLIVGLPVS
jgi:ABC-2 type transport system permease protein